MEIEKFRKCSKKFDSCATNNFVFYGSREISRDQKVYVYFLNKDPMCVSLLECQWSFDNKHQNVYIRPSAHFP